MRGRWLPPVGSLAAVAAATLLVYALKPVAPTLSLGVLYVLAVLATSVLFGLGWAIAAALGSMLAFNFLFLPPVHTLTLADGRNWAALGVYVATAVVASQLAARARRRAVEAEQREREAALLSDAAAALLRGDATLDEMRDRAQRVLAGADETARGRFDAALEALEALARERERLDVEARDTEALRRSDAIKTAVLRTVSHDFRTPLATMRAAVDGLEGSGLSLTDHDRAELLETIRLEVARLSRLVENLLDLSRLQAGAAEPRLALWAVDDLLERAAAEASAPERVRVEAAAGLPAVRVDATQLQRALVNLVDNALKFSPPHEEVVVGAAEEGGEVVLRVLDRGPGIEPGESSALLAPFVRGRGGSGAGLGLAIADGFAGVNGGSLTLAPRPGGGTCASLALPAVQVPTGTAA